MQVWTKQHSCVWEEIQRSGRYVARGAGIFQNEDARLMMPAYDWLAAALPAGELRPADAEYPIWVSARQETTMLQSPDTVILELEVEEALLSWINVAKWGAINNFSYLPADEADDRRHRKQMQELGISDAEACLSRFYPELRQEIRQSWQRLFDDHIRLGSSAVYGLLWELRRPWIKRVIRW